MGGGDRVEETSKQRALADIGKAQMADFKQRWLPVQQKFAESVVKAGGADSFERRRATTMTGVDNSAAYSQAADKLDATAATKGSFGSSGHKLGITGMADDRATSTGLGAVAADQAVDSQYVAGLGAVTALGRGEKATALSGMEQAAAMSGRQAQADAMQSLENRRGNMQAAGTVVGMGAGLWSGGGGGVKVDSSGTNLFENANANNIPPPYGAWQT